MRFLKEMARAKQQQQQLYPGMFNPRNQTPEQQQQIQQLAAARGMTSTEFQTLVLYFDKFWGDF